MSVKSPTNEISNDSVGLTDTSAGHFAGSLPLFYEFLGQMLGALATAS